MQSAKKILVKKYHRAIATSNHPMSIYYAYLLGYITKKEFDSLRVEQKTPANTRVLSSK